MLYTVTAFRWGWLNNHQYPVATTGSEDRALELAEAECNDRGGKYGVAVYEWSSEEEYTRVAYFASSYGETEPVVNERLTMFNSVGHDAHEVAMQGVYWRPNAQSVLEPQYVEVPEWLRNSVERHEVQQRFLAQLLADTRARKIAGQPERTTEESGALYRSLQAEVKNLLEAASERGKATCENWVARTPKLD